MRRIAVWTAVLVIITAAGGLGRGARDETAHGRARAAAATRQRQTSATQGRGQHQIVRQRTTLEKLLGHHVILAVRMMRAQIRQAPDLVQILRDAISTNAGDLVAAVRSVHGDRAAETFRTLWTDHNVALIQYAEAIAANDRAGEEASEEDLDRYRRRFGQFAESVTNSKLQARSVARALGTHIDQLLDQSEAYADRKFTTAYRLQRQAYAHMFPTGNALTGSGRRPQPGELPIHLSRPAQQLRSELALMLGEHVELVVDATRAGLRGLAEFKHAADALNANTRDITEAFGALVGNRSARVFNDIWSDHIDLFMDYTIATVQNKDADRDAARRRLRAFQERFGRYLAEATGNKRGVAAVAHELGMHEDLLLRQIDAYAAEEYGQAHRLSYAAYQDMFKVATRLSALIAVKTQKTSPTGAAQTGGGGTALHPHN